MYETLDFIIRNEERMNFSGHLDRQPRAQGTYFTLVTEPLPSTLPVTIKGVQGGSVSLALYVSPEAPGSYKLQRCSRQLLECPVPTAQKVAWAPRDPRSLATASG